jgi:hypothetical protein
MDNVGGYLMVGYDHEGQVVVNLDHDRTGHLIFSPAQARHLARLLVAKAQEAEQACVIDVQSVVVVN